MEFSAYDVDEDPQITKQSRFNPDAAVGDRTTCFSMSSKKTTMPEHCGRLEAFELYSAPPSAVMHFHFDEVTSVIESLAAFFASNIAARSKSSIA